MKTSVIYLLKDIIHFYLIVNMDFTMNSKPIIPIFQYSKLKPLQNAP